MENEKTSVAQQLSKIRQESSGTNIGEKAAIMAEENYALAESTRSEGDPKGALGILRGTLAELNDILETCAYGAAQGLSKQYGANFDATGFVVGDLTSIYEAEIGRLSRDSRDDVNQYRGYGIDEGYQNVGARFIIDQAMNARKPGAFLVLPGKSALENFLEAHEKGLAKLTSEEEEALRDTLEIREAAGSGIQMFTVKGETQ